MEIRDYFKIKLKEIYLKEMIDVINSEVDNDNYKRIVHIHEIHFDTFEHMLATKEFYTFCDEQENELNEYINLLLYYKKNPDKIGVNKNGQKEFLKFVDGLTDSSELKEKMNLLDNRDYLNTLMFLNAESNLPDILLNQIGGLKEKNVDGSDEKAKNFLPKDVDDFFEKKKKYFSENMTLIKAGSMDFINLFGKELKRANFLIQEKVIDYFYLKNPLRGKDYRDYVVKNIFSKNLDDQYQFLRAKSTYDQNTIDFFEEIKYLLIDDSYVAKKFINTNGEILNKVAQDLNVETHAALFLLFSQENKKVNLDNSSLMEKMINKSKALEFSSVKKKLDNPDLYESLFKNLMKDVESAKLKIKRDTLLSKMDDENFNAGQLKKGRLINFNMEFFMDYLPKIKNSKSMVDMLSYKTNNLEIFNKFGNSYIFISNNLNVDNLTDNEILKEVFLCTEKCFFKDIEKKNIDVAQVILELEGSIRSTSLQKNISKNNLEKDTRAKVKI